ncbi:glyceraldehyde-3-phosphate dehydrogenase [Vibrio sp. E150_011]
MQMRYTRFITLALFSLFSFHCLAVSFTDPVDNKLDMGEYLAENAYGFLPVPIVITEPALGYGGGMMGVFLHESDSQKAKRKKEAQKSLNGGAKLLTPGISVVGAFGTQNGTWGGFVGHRQTWKKDSIRYLGGAFYGDIHMNFYTPLAGADADGFEMSMNGGGVMQKLQFRIADTPLFLGFTQQFVKPKLSIVDADKINHIATTWLNTDPNVSGLGLIAEYYTRNSFLYPTAGGDYIAKYQVYDDSIGSDYDYQTFKVQGVQYFPLAKQWDGAIKAQYNTLSTDERLLPPAAYPDIELRGIGRNRYQGTSTASVETQVTYKITNRWSTSLFGGVGSATDATDELFKDDRHYSYGTGVRYLIARRYGLRVGIDIAKSEEDRAVYFQVGTGI